jgi:AraC-like DNA-binding protein
MLHRSDLTTGLAVFTPPYTQLEEIDLQWRPTTRPPRGVALVWWIRDGAKQQEQFEWLHRRPFGVPLFVVLPRPSEIRNTMPLLAHVNALGPRAILPIGPLASTEYLRQLLRLPPCNVAVTVTRYLHGRGLLHHASVRKEVYDILACLPEASSITQVARRLYTSRRTLGRHFADAGIPVPSHWLQFGRLLHAILVLQSQDTSVAKAAARMRYPDAFTLSNQMKRMLGFRPTEARCCLGWEWVIESWLCRETRAGGFDYNRYYDSLSVYTDEGPH